MAWHTAEAAAFDLQLIAEDGLVVFGEHHARKYVSELIDMFETLAAHPYMAPERQAALRAVRLMPCGSHNILYVVENEDVIVLRVLHGLQNWFELL